MIVVTAVGFIADKPKLNVFPNSQNCEFDVVSTRREKQGNEWVSVYERATFIVWGEEAERIASRLDRGHVVTATGRQKTSKWTDGQGIQRSKIKFDLLSWEKLHTASSGSSSRPEGNQDGGGHHDDGYDNRRQGGQPPRSTARSEPHQSSYGNANRPPMRYARPSPAEQRHHHPDQSGQDVPDMIP